MSLMGFYTARALRVSSCEAAERAESGVNRKGQQPLRSDANDAHKCNDLP